MKYNILFTGSAEKDMQDSFKWYENESIGLGWEFRNEIAICITRILDDTVSFQIYFGEIRKIAIERFPYLIYYKKDEQLKKIVIGAILHERRNPNTINQHLGL